MRKLGKRGFTLMECVVAFAVISVISVAAIVAFNSAINAGKREWDKYRISMTADNILAAFQSSTDGTSYSAKMEEVLGCVKNQEDETSEYEVTGYVKNNGYDMSTVMVPVDYGTIRVFDNGIIKFYQDVLALDKEGTVVVSCEYNDGEETTFATDSSVFSTSSLFNKAGEKKGKCVKITVEGSSEKNGEGSQTIGKTVYKCTTDKKGKKTYSKVTSCTCTWKETTTYTLVITESKITFSSITEYSDVKWKGITAYYYKNKKEYTQITDQTAPAAPKIATVSKTKTTSTTSFEKHLLSQGLYLMYDSNSKQENTYLYLAVYDASNKTPTKFAKDGKYLYFRVKYSKTSGEWNSDAACLTISGDIKAFWSNKTNIKDIAKSENFQNADTFNSVFGTSLTTDSVKWYGYPVFIVDNTATVAFPSAGTSVTSEKENGYRDYTAKDSKCSNILSVTKNNNKLTFYNFNKEAFFEFDGELIDKITAQLKAAPISFVETEENGTSIYCRKEEKKNIDGVEFLSRDNKKVISFYSGSGANKDELFSFEYTGTVAFENDKKTIVEGEYKGFYNSDYTLKNPGLGSLQRTQEGYYYVAIDNAVIFTGHISNVEGKYVDLSETGDIVVESKIEVKGSAITMWYSCTKGEYACIARATFSESAFSGTVFQPQITIWVVKETVYKDWNERNITPTEDPYCTYKKG